MSTYPGHSAKLLRIAERDNWTCGICRLPVKPYRYTGRGGSWSKVAPTLDHIVPRSLGGSSADENLRLAHGKCNWQRRAGTPGEGHLLTDPNYVKPKPRRAWNA